MVTEEDIINKYNEIIIDAPVEDLVELLPEIESDQFIMQNLTAMAKEKMKEAKKYAKNNPN
ncbi:MAG: hypothetical protein SCH70_06785 [Candidatus Methanoperedens sp.]|nr:hypothetical protein [Candidatus Methanoperedens sp.]